VENKMGFLDKYTRAEIEKFVKESENYIDVLIKMGRSTNSGSNRMLITQYIKDNNIDVSHFNADFQKRTPKDIFIENSTASQSTLRRYYKKGNYSEYKCAICGLDPVWNGKELVLTLDHINGKNSDHRLNNLRWVCPNCDRQLPTYGTKRKKVECLCVKCGSERSRKNKSGLCKECYWESVRANANDGVTREKRGNRTIKTKQCPICGKVIQNNSDTCLQCYHEKSRKVQRPEPLELAKMIKEIGFEATGKHFGVGGNAVVKWCKSFGIPDKKQDVVDWYNEQMGIIPEPKRIKTPINEIVRPVCQIDIETGEVLNTFSSQADALRSLGKTTYDNHISQVCRGLRRSAHGYGWQYAD
jgi:hypothetical protein